MPHFIRAVAALSFTMLSLAAAGPVGAGLPPGAPAPADPVMAGPHARYSKAPINNGSPNLALTLALVTAGGGAATFDARKLMAVLTGNGPLTENETASLTKRFGAANVASFYTTFGFVIADALAQAAKGGIALPLAPLPDPADGPALAAALYAAGATPRANFDVEYLLDTLVSHPIHVQIMNDIDADPNFGFKADANYHAVFAQALLDLKPGRRP